MLKGQQQKSSLFDKWWIIANLVALPFAGLAIFVIAGSVSWGASFNGFDLQLWVQFLPAVIMGGGLCGVMLGLLQGSILRIEYIQAIRWTLATSCGMALDAVLAYGAWQLYSLAESRTLSLYINLFAYVIFTLLAVFHGCSLALVQWLVLRREDRTLLSSWPWIAGISWSFLTPFLYAFTMHYWRSLEGLLFGDFIAVYIPFLLFSLPYNVLTTVLWTRRSVERTKAAAR